jgi:hypothetical protein
MKVMGEYKITLSICQRTFFAAAHAVSFNRNVTLNVEDASCTEAWIDVKFSGVEFPAELRFYINDSLAESITGVKDTLLYIEGLQPSRTYRVRAEAVRPQETVVKSSEAEVTTMDTTSHNFTWQTYTFGGSEAAVG